MKKIFSNSIIYVISILFNKGLSFALLPILTHYLSKEDYGILSLVMAVTTISSIYVGFFPSTFLITRFSSYGKEKIAEYMANIAIIIIVSYIIVLFILLILQNILLPSFLEHRSLVLFSVSLYALGTVFFNVLDTIFQLEKNALKFALLQTIQSVSAVGLTLLVIIEFHEKWQGKFYSELFLLGIIFVYTIYYIVKNKYCIFSFEMKKIKEIFIFLFPLSFNVLGLYILGTLDRIFIAHMISLEAAGIYTVAVSLAFIVNIAYDSILKAIRPYFNEYLAKETKEYRKKVKKITYAYSFMCLVTLGGFLLSIPYVFHWMIDIKYNQALEYIPFLAVALTFEGLRKILALYYTYYGQGKILAVFTIIAAIFNTILNYFLIPMDGIAGAVESILITFVLLYFSMLLYLLKKEFILKENNVK